MPHKHTRRDKDLSTFDLPPTQLAKSLPVTTVSKKKAPPPTKKQNDQKKSGGKRKRAGPDDGDGIPRAFKRLMAFNSGKPTRNGLDNGDGPRTKEARIKAAKKAAKQAAAAAAAAAAPAPAQDESKADELKIRPGERMWEFSQRVDAALPLSGLVNKTVKDGKDPLGLKVKRTKKERKMHKMYDEWREEDRKIKEKREEERELEEEKALDEEINGTAVKFATAEPSGKGKKKKGKRSRLVGEDASKEDDPWKEIIKKRGEAKVGLHEVANAPPELIKLQKKKLLVAGASVEVSDIPKSAGSLRQREELQGIRDEVVANYRKMIGERRSQAEAAAAES
ncbi:hypothetical protein QBC39DRAFT_359310 [Podospora conica]|nr:hypothetical protein QBC39DRAFT_359310 [Schizothecium conicum]